MARKLWLHPLDAYEKDGGRITGTERVIIASLILLHGWGIYGMIAQGVSWLTK